MTCSWRIVFGPLPPSERFSNVSASQTLEKRSLGGRGPMCCARVGPWYRQHGAGRRHWHKFGADSMLMHTVCNNAQ
ncbi:hypothetical protein COLSTE_00381 [Collinsella stercoris DSM 13279]|uniref:Uncharacterized protein n=1 Tax=Collinsella stercoris DSM 13279 TaxID=445975 RepID=B6G8J0_9ACTN|nr:hypothetical protein COLSTE_00381 [Collinsella stercoris DSM 13279]